MRRIVPHWAIFALLSAFCFAVMAACVRIASSFLPQSEVVFFRNFIGFLLLLPFLLQQQVTLRTSQIKLHLFRSLTGLAAMACYFYSIKKLPLADAVLLNYTSPIFVGLIASFWLKEQLTLRRKLAIAVGLLGVLCLFRPSAAIASTAGLMGLVSGLLAGFALTSVKKLSATDPGTRIVFYFSLFSSLISAVPMLWQFVMPSFGLMLLLLGLGFVGTVGQLFLTQAYKLAPASQVSPLGFFGLIFAGLIGFVLWGETPDVSMLVGMLFIVTSGVLVVRERAEPMPSPPSGAPPVDSEIE